MPELNEQERQWIENLSKAIERYIEKTGWKVKDISGMLSVPNRNMQRLVAGLRETHLTFATTETYAALFYHCGISEADPRRIPNERAYSGTEYRAWRMKQGTPLLLSPLQEIAENISETLNMFQDILSDPFLSNAISFVQRENLEKLKHYIELLMITPEEREKAIGLLEIMNPQEGTNV